MREYLFRGKRKDTGEWVEGYLFRIWSEAYILWGTTNGIPDMVEVYPETVGQYTELDVKGTKIFDGDILHVVSVDYDYDYITSVGAKYGFISGFYVDGHFDDGDFNEIGFAFEWWENEGATIEVIGNIHDNPELLEVNNDETDRC